MLKIGTKIKIGDNYFVVIALPNETKHGVLLRNLSDKRAIYMPDTVTYEIISEDEILYASDMEDREKKKLKEKLLNENLDLIINILSNCNVEFNNLINKVSYIRNLDAQQKKMDMEYPKGY